MEAPVKKILSGAAVDDVVSKDAMRNPAAIEVFTKLRIP
jgi:hypothetical protein